MIMSEKSVKHSRRESKEQPGSGKKLKTSPLASVGTANGRKIIYEFDQSYKFIERKMKKQEEPLNYIPVYFLRAHSKNNDAADVQTQIWQCAFEPDPQNSGKFTNIVATCGGTSVCFINVDTGEVVLKYVRSTKVNASDNLYALAWSSIPLDEKGFKRMNILAAGGGKSTVVLIHPEAGCCYQMFRTVPNKAAGVINSLLFHPKKACWLFCGHEDGHIQLWDVGVPHLPNYNVTPTQLIIIPNIGGDVFNLVFSHLHDVLIGGCEQGLFAWEVDLDKIEKNHRLKHTRFNLPDLKDDGTVVDSICLIRDDILAVKCALHGYIYIFHLSEQLKKVEYNEDEKLHEVNLTEDCLLKLKWSETDNFYMNMGIDKTTGTLVCGDDKGKLWMYKLYPYISGNIPSPVSGGGPITPVENALLLDWPDLEDQELEKARKLRLDSYDIVVDKCAVSNKARHIVAVTSNNMVCIWKRVTQKVLTENETN